MCLIGQRGFARGNVFRPAQPCRPTVLNCWRGKPACELVQRICGVTASCALAARFIVDRRTAQHGGRVAYKVY